MSDGLHEDVGSSVRDVRWHPERRALVVQGTLSRDLGQQLREAVRDRLAEPTGAVRVDLSGVDFADSAGLGALVSLRKWAHRDGFELHLDQPSEPLLRLMRMTRLDRFLLTA